jgi:hypothetical protein
MGRQRPRQVAVNLPTPIPTPLKLHTNNLRTSLSPARTFMSTKVHADASRQISSSAPSLHTRRATIEDDTSDTGLPTGRQEHGQRSPENTLDQCLLSPLAAIAPELTTKRAPISRGLDPVGPSQDYPTPQLRPAQWEVDQQSSAPPLPMSDDTKRCRQAEKSAEE